jgi:membrane protease YdiL (CAAX protease family)
VPSSPDAASPARSRVLLEVLLTYALCSALAALAYRVRALDEWFNVVVAALFLYTPAWVLRRRDLADFGLTARPLGANLALLAVVVAVVFPPFFAGFYLWGKAACALPGLRGLSPTVCGEGGLWPHALRLPPGALSLDPRRNVLLAELLVVALPEEFFFRGYVQGRLSEVWPARRRLLGAEVGAALLVGATLFALGHVIVQGRPATLAVFFPGLVFGWMRARSGSILPGTLFHALCNVYIDTLSRSAPH